MKLHNVDGFDFEFKGALDAFVFDSEDKSDPHYNNAPMKKVDIVVEFADADVYVEIKDHTDAAEFEEKTGRAADNQLREELKYKYRDSYLFRYAEGKTEKPVHYVCLLAGFDNAMAGGMRDDLARELPVKAFPRWKKPIADSCHVVNLKQWNQYFPEWPAWRAAKS